MMDCLPGLLQRRYEIIMGVDGADDEGGVMESLGAIWVRPERRLGDLNNVLPGSRPNLKRVAAKFLALLPRRLCMSSVSHGQRSLDARIGSPRKSFQPVIDLGFFASRLSIMRFDFAIAGMSFL